MTFHWAIQLFVYVFISCTGLYGFGGPKPVFSWEVLAQVDAEGEKVRRVVEEGKRGGKKRKVQSITEGS